MTRFIALILTGLLLTACTPLMVQQAGSRRSASKGHASRRTTSSASMAPSRPLRMGCDDGRSLGGDRRRPRHERLRQRLPHGAPWWASEGITTIAYDQRGFGRSPGRGVWAGDELMVEDLRTVAALARQKYPRAVLVVAGESLGGAVAAEPSPRTVRRPRTGWCCCRLLSGAGAISRCPTKRCCGSPPTSPAPRSTRRRAGSPPRSAPPTTATS